MAQVDPLANMHDRMFILSVSPYDNGHLPLAGSHDRKSQEPGGAQVDTPSSTFDRIDHSLARLHERALVEEVQADLILSTWLLRDMQVPCSPQDASGKGTATVAYLDPSWHR